MAVWARSLGIQLVGPGLGTRDQWLDQRYHFLVLLDITIVTITSY